MRPRISIRACVRPSVRLSVRRSVVLCNAFVKNARKSFMSPILSSPFNAFLCLFNAFMPFQCHSDASLAAGPCFLFLYPFYFHSPYLFISLSYLYFVSLFVLLTYFVFLFVHDGKLPTYTSPTNHDRPIVNIFNFCVFRPIWMKFSLEADIEQKTT